MGRKGFGGKDCFDLNLPHPFQWDTCTWPNLCNNFWDGSTCMLYDHRKCGKSETEKKRGNSKCGQITRCIWICANYFSHDSMCKTVMSSWCLLESWEWDHPIPFQYLNVKVWDQPTEESNNKNFGTLMAVEVPRWKSHLDRHSCGLCCSTLSLTTYIELLH